MYLDDYFEAMGNVLAAIRDTQRPAIETAGEAEAQSLANGGALSVMDTGHMMRHEALCRAGGMMVVAPFAYDLMIDNDMEQRAGAPRAVDEAELEKRKVALALDASNLRRGDVLVVNSNSGRTSNVIEVAVQCSERGIITIAISSEQQMRQCSAAHPSGKKLFDVADICVDNCGPFGDAMVEVEDNEKTCPASGLAGCYVFWAIHAEAVERLQAMGVNPRIYRSVHVSGHEYIDTQREQFLERGV